MTMHTNTLRCPRMLRSRQVAPVGRPTRCSASSPREPKEVQFMSSTLFLGRSGDLAKEYNAWQVKILIQVAYNPQLCPCRLITPS